MSATNKTTNYELPIFLGTDKPAWLVDWNGAMNLIDTAIKQAETKADQASVDVGSIQSDIITINSSLTTLNSAVSQLRLDTNSNTGAINTIQELIGNGTPTTTDKTIIGAINEINSDMTDALEIYTLNAPDGVTPTISSAIGTVSSNSSIRTLKTAHDAFIKVFGNIALTNVSVPAGDEPVFATISNTGFTVSQEYKVHGYSANRLTSDWVTIGILLKIKTDGSVDVCLDGTQGSPISYTTLNIMLPPCLLLNSSIE